MTEYHLSTFDTLAASTVAPNFGRLLNSRCQQHCCSDMVNAGWHLCLYSGKLVSSACWAVIKTLLLTFRSARIPETCNPSCQLESLSMPSVDCTRALKTLIYKFCVLNRGKPTEWVCSSQRRLRTLDVRWHLNRYLQNCAGGVLGYYTAISWTLRLSEVCFSFVIWLNCLLLIN